MNFRSLLNFEGINWWTLLGGLGLNFVITVFTSIGGFYLASNEGTQSFYANFGPPLMVVWIFLVCALAGYITGKVADDLPLKHAFWGSLGAVVPLFVGAGFSFLVSGPNPTAFLLPVVASAGAMNGGMLATPRPRYRPPDRN